MEYLQRRNEPGGSSPYSDYPKRDVWSCLPGLQPNYPGMTGLWQVTGRNHTTFARRAELDMEYIQRWSLWLDIYIIFQTIKEVLAREGAY